MTSYVLKDAELTPQERVGLVASWLTAGEVLTVQQIAERLGIRRRVAERILDNLSRVLALYSDADGRPGARYAGGKWRLVSRTEGGDE